MQAIKTKKCRFCREPFLPERQMQVVCNLECAIKLRDKKKDDEYKKQTREMKKRLLSNNKKHWKKLAQKTFNAWIRNRDAHLPCISCGTTKTIQWDAGHYMPAGANAALRFDENNVNKQCCYCNDGSKLSGNLTKYRIGLVKKIGEDAVVSLETNKEIKRWTIDELKEICKKYRMRK